MSRRLGWAFGAIAPWSLGVALAISIPADAGQEIASGASVAMLSLRAPAAPQDLIPDQAASLAAAFANRDAGSSKGVWAGVPETLRKVSLAAEGEGERLADETLPRTDRKRAIPAAPKILRESRGDPAVGLRPTFDAPLRSEGGLARLRARGLLFEHDVAWPVGALDESAAEFVGPDAVAAFEPWPDGEAPTTAPSPAAASPRQEGGALTMRPAALNERLAQGATPQVRRAEALGSTTPAPVDLTPVEAAAISAAPSSRTPRQDAETSAAPRQTLARTDEAEQRCLAEAVYFEARGETEDGQAAVAQVVLNRVASGLYPSTICGVVYQNRQRRNACQFSFACEGRALRVGEPEAWRMAVRVAAAVASGATYLPDVGAATHYHASYVRPRWSQHLEKMDVIGRHIFYRLRPGQT